MKKPEPSKRPSELDEKVRIAVAHVPNFLTKDTSLQRKLIEVEPHKYIVRTQHVTEDAYAWVENGRRVVHHLGEEMRLRGTKDDPRYKALEKYFTLATGLYPLGNVTVQGLTKTRDIPTLCDALYPDFSPGIVNPFLVDLLTKKTARETNLLGVLYAESRDEAGYFTRPPVLCLHLK